MTSPLLFFGQKRLEVSTKGRSFVDITAGVQKEVEATGCSHGSCHLFIQHTSASLIVCENADPTVRSDLEAFVQNKFCPDGLEFFEHTAEGIDDMPAHVRSVFTQTSLTLPVVDNRLGLGTWQGVYLWEHRLEPHHRKVLLSVQGTK